MSVEYNFDFAELDAAIESLGEEIREHAADVEEPECSECQDKDPDVHFDSVEDILQHAREVMKDKYTDVQDCEDALHAVKKEAELTNSSLNNMADAARKYAAKEIDKEEHDHMIQESLTQIRIPVKELQMHLGRSVDPNSAPTNHEIKEFKAYVEGYIAAIESRMEEIDQSSVEHEGAEGAEECDDVMSDLESLLHDLESEIGDDDDEDIELEGEDKDRTNADKFADACESLMIDMTHGHSLRGAVESLLDDLTDFM